MTTTISAGDHPRFLWVAGPLRIRVDKGAVILLEAEYGEGEEVVVHRDRSYLLEVKPGSKVTAGGLGGVIREASTHEVDVYLRWRESAASLAGNCTGSARCIIVVLGPTDVGKTSFITMLANRLLNHTEVGIMDTDLGQSTLGVPGFIAFARVRDKLLWDRVPRYEHLYFVGSITPVGYENVVTTAASFLSARFGHGPLLVDTDGWLKGARAIRYKVDLARALGADHVVLIGVEGDEYRALARVFRGRVTSLEPPPRRVVRSSRERRMLRGDKMFLVENMERILVTPVETPFIGTLTLGLGKPLEEDELSQLEKSLGSKPLYGEEFGGRTLALVKQRPRTRPPSSIVTISLADVRGMIVSIADEGGNDVSYGLVSGFDEARKSFVIKVPRNTPTPQLVRTGSVKFDGESIIVDNRLKVLQKLIEN